MAFMEFFGATGNMQWPCQTGVSSFAQIALIMRALLRRGQIQFAPAVILLSNY
jgi:hypothetical protein